jgi:hypothetical protein
VSVWCSGRGGFARGRGRVARLAIYFRVFSEIFLSESPVEIHFTACGNLCSYFYWPPAQAVGKNASRNRSSTAGVEVLCTSVD